MEERKNLSRRSFVTGATAATVSAALVASGLTSYSHADESGSGADAEGEWIPTSCNMCFSQCSILAHVVDGVVVELKGNSNSPVGEGRMCGKGAAGIMQLYDANRISKPLRRTNPEKGLDQDPGWEEITWEEAYEQVAAWVLEGQAAGPNKIIGTGGVASHASLSNFAQWMASAIGGTYFMPDICGAGIHNVSHIYASDGNAQPDHAYNKYLLQWGSNAGIATRHGFNMTANRFAESRANGTKFVVLDPHMSSAAEKADKWIPLVPGTDAAVALAMANVLVHELNIVDIDFITKRTNGPALVSDETKRVLRAAETNKALFMDADGVAKPYDEASAPVLEGAFTVDGVACKTAWTLYKDHLKTYTPEYAESISTVPAATIRQIAKEFGEAACIGETIEIDGHVVPYRPVCADMFSGVSRHKHSMLSHWAIAALNLIVGSVNAAGGLIGYAAACNGFDESGHVSYRPTIWEEDGFMQSSGCHFAFPQSFYSLVRDGISWNGSRTLSGLLPLCEDPHFIYYTLPEPEKYNLEPADELLFIYAANPLKNWGNHDVQAKLLKGFKHVVGVDLYLSDSSYFCDIMLPEATYLERYDTPPHAYNNLLTPGVIGTPWVMALRQPVVESRDGAPGWLEIASNITDRIGANAAMNGTLNYVWALKEDVALGEEKMEPEALLDATYKSWTGEHDLAWFKENGFHAYGGRTVDELYIWADDAPGRVPLYWDFMLEAKEKIAAIVEEQGIEWELDDYQPLPDWKPCVDFEITDPDFDLLPVYYTDAVNADSWSVNNPWINEINEMSEISYFIEMNSQTAAAKGLASGDDVVLSSKEGATVEGKLVVTECVHPQVVASLVGMLGHKSEYLKIGKDKGAAIDHLIPGDDVHRLDYVSAAFDQCVRCKIEKK